LLLFFVSRQPSGADLSAYRFTPLATDSGYQGAPAWSPDGTRIAFLSAGGRLNVRENLWVMDRDGSGARRITSETVFPSFNWSPNGSEIAYVRFSDSDTSYINGTIWVINPTTLATRQVTVNPRP